MEIVPCLSGSRRRKRLSAWTADHYRGRGDATEVPQDLAEFALRHSDVETMRAHTCPQENASTSVLKKAGFEKTGDGIDPGNGLVWRWELRGTAEE